MVEYFRPVLRRAMLIVALSVLVAGLVLPAVAQVNPFGEVKTPEKAQDPITGFSGVMSISSAEPGKTYTAAAVLKIRAGWHINSASPYQSYLIPAELSFIDTDGFHAHSIQYPEGHDVLMDDQTLSVYDGRVIIHFQVTVDEDMEPGEYVLPISFTGQPCNDRECLPPRTEEADLNVKVGPEGHPIFAEMFTRIKTSEPEPSESELSETESTGQESELSRLISEYGFWGYFLALGLAFVTGLLLSFSPCTYPMIPITVSIFAGQERSIGRGFFLSLIYVGTMAVMYGIMGLIVSLVGGVFGAWLASPAVVIGIAVVFVIFALSMFGLYDLNVPQSLRQKLGTTKTGGGVVGSIILGIIAALVVSPCVGPFVAGILLYVATHGSPLIGFLVLFVFALGLGTLYVIVGTFSTAVNALPGSGEWMETIKKFFGFVLLVMALYFLRTIISPTLIAILAGLLLISFAVFGGALDRLTPEAKFFLRLKKLVGLLALLMGIYLLMGTVIMQGVILPPASQWLPVSAGGEEAEAVSLIPWETDLQAGLDRAGAEGKPVLIDTWATWCVNCKVLDKKTFGHAGVAAEAARFVPLKVQLESAQTPVAQDFMQRFGLKHYSLPTTLLLDSSGKVARILQGVVNPEDMIAELRRIH